MNELEIQNGLLKDLLRMVVEILPRHSADCGVFRAHASYGDKFCDCNLEKLRTEIRNKLKE